MARISTYQHDAMPHAQDNVIGTNQSPGHASETVLFSLSAIENLFRAGVISINNYNRTSYDNDFYADLNNLVQNQDQDGGSVPEVGDIPLPAITITHTLQTDMPAVILTADVTAISLDANGNAILGAVTRLGQILESNTTHPYTIEYPSADNNLLAKQVRITFQNRSIYSGTITLLG